MQKSLLKFVGIGCVLALAACQSSDDSAYQETSGVRSSADDIYVPEEFTKFVDIPLPSKAEMIVPKTIIFGERDKWLGRLYFTAPYNFGGMIDFYSEEMPKYGWKKLSIFRSDMNVLAFERKDRMATITFIPQSDGTEVSLVVSPKGMERKI